MIKLFHERRHDELETSVQNWLQSNPMIQITSMAAASSNYGHTITLLYTDGGQPHGYLFATFFQRVGGFGGLSVESVEEEAQERMDGRGRPYLVAQSANEMGLFVALLLEADHED